MNNDTANAYRVGQQIELTRNNIAAAVKKLKHTKLALDVFFFTTWILYFVFAMGMYVADLWGITTWLSQNTSEMVAFIIFLALALGMATGLSIFKHVFYEHRAEFVFGIGAVLIVAGVGIFFEAINSSSQQQNIAYGKAESSKGYESVAATTISVGSPSDTGQAAFYQGELARYKSLNSTCKKNCNQTRAKVAEFGAKVQSMKESSKAAAASVGTATAAAITAKAETLQKMKDEQHKPIFKSVRDIFGTTIATAIMIITLIVSGAFEYCHALLSKILGQKLGILASLRELLINQETSYMQATGKQYAAADFDGMESNLSHHQPAKQDYKKTSQGFGFMPQTAKTEDHDRPTLFKYQQKPQAEPERQPFGFVPNRKPGESLDAENRRKYPQTIVQPQGTRETLTYRDELRKDFKGFRDTALDAQSPAPAAPANQKPGGTGLQNPALGSAEKHYALPLPHGTSTDETGAGGELTDKLYEKLKGRIAMGEIEPMTKPVKQLLKAWQVGRNDDHRQHIAGQAFDRMYREGVLKLNPEQGKFKRKYLLA